jgi:hypothetical protein
MANNITRAQSDEEDGMCLTDDGFTAIYHEEKMNKTGTRIWALGIVLVALGFVAVVHGNRPLPGNNRNALTADNKDASTDPTQSPGVPTTANIL